ncbi:aminodeoxychorismate synthase component 1 [Vibrio sp. Of7-15]|uniref:aminodeoxychorismate synthase component 1 n=1 Tax=Vibrio sp. Of7-15 TaxID=2724879 RepID=UPI001EF3C0B8|nr:aminodeoxychorismate synthase component 1 [Vibrio sp. Of7-15]MCG7497087.1 aminodeoxychorismate synthase component 1 [Vibrio sp. Of7-15]
MNCKLKSTLTFQELEYNHRNILDFFEPISNLPWAMLLRSAAEQHPDNRFDILVADPVATLVTHGNNTQICVNGKQTVNSDQDPFALLGHYKMRLLPDLPVSDDLPFLGGALGYFSYDLGRRVEAMPSSAEHDIPTADMAIGLYDWALIADHKLKKLTLVQPHGADRLHWLESFAQIHQPTTRFALTSPWQANMSKEVYTQKFNQVQEYLRSGDCYQINLTQRFKAQYEGSEWLAYKQLEQANQAPFSGFIRTPEATILSISPERFLQLEQQAIQTKPIKGTRPRSSDPKLDTEYAKDLQQAEKDRSENLMIVDLLRNDIGRVAKPGSVSVPHLFEIESFPAVHHLVSTITATLDDKYQAEDLLRACFPGGSITGAPKIRAMEIIEELEPHRRNVYCGSIGYISRCGKVDTSITIRTLIAHEQNLHAWAGGGIVADSQADAEYQETLDKLSRILPVLE